MLGKKRAGLAGVGLLCLLAGVSLWAANTPSQDERRDAAQKAFTQGNYKVAYDAYRRLAIDKTTDPNKVGADLLQAIASLQNLGRIDEIDELRETSVAAQPKSWRLLQAAAGSFRSSQPYGYVVAGQFYRGYRRGGGRFVNCLERDRVRALQMMTQALPLVAKEADKAAAGEFYLTFANLLQQGVHHHESWRLQYLTDLSKLPDYGEGYYYGSGGRGAPVDGQNRPVYYAVPKSYEAAANDGERWRWMLTQVVEMQPGRANEVDMLFANFCRGQFGVQTMAHWGWRGRDTGGDQKTGTFALHTLKDTETIARLASGVQRFSVPDEYNWIKIYQRIVGRDKDSYSSQAADLLAGEFEDRRQYVKAAAAWKKAIADQGAAEHRTDRLNQIVGNWGRFEPGTVQPAGKRAQVDFRFRNGKKVTFEATAIKVDQLLADVKAYLKGKPGQFNLQGNRPQVDWDETNIGDLGYRLVTKNQTKYLGDKVATWTQELKPRPAHVDDRITVTTPLDRPGAYLLTAQLETGNISRVIVWVADTVLLKKQLDGKAYYYVGDAVTGAPVPKANVEYFGWRVVQVAPQRNQFRVETANFARNTDADGQVFLTADEQTPNYQWLITARKERDGQGGADRLAYYGFTGVWFNRRYDPEYNATRTFLITDRPVYRPDNPIHFKAWVRHAKYDQADTSDFAHREFNVVIRNPKGDKIYEKTLTTDEYAGLEGELKLAKDATLGVYSIQVGDQWNVGQFRLEEYKKPEFEVKVEAPKEPVKLGDKIEATIQAKYYFGAPVVNAKVKYKVLRTQHTTTWYPAGLWDWFYGPGYWWFASDYDWYPGWRVWGCVRPVPPWWGFRRHEPPEVVLENEVPIGPDGTVKVTIDTTAAKELHGDEDHAFAITAEVVDESRRTIVGTGNVIAARKPFQVFAWVDRGYYRVGDTIRSSFRGLTPDRKPVQGTGVVTLYRVTYDRDGKPEEKAVQMWNVDTDADGYARQQIDASKPGQYRVSYQLSDTKKNTIEGGYVFVVRGDGVTGKDYRFNAVELITDKREYAPGDKVQLLVNTDTLDGTVLLFLRPTNGVYQAPKVVRIRGKSTVEMLDVTQKDMPNFFVEAVTVHGGKVHSEVREVVVPPEKRVLNVEVLPNQQEYKPGQKATVKVKLTDFFGQPFVGTTVLTVYDRAVEYISGGSNVPEIREFFWKWRRHHQPSTEHNLSRHLANLLKQGERGMGDLGVFGGTVVEELQKAGEKGNMLGRMGGFGGGYANRGMATRESGVMRDAQSAPMAAAPAGPGGAPAEAKSDFLGDGAESDKRKGASPGKPGMGPGAPGAAGVEPTVRQNFADTAVWKGSLTTGKDGTAEITFPMPEQLTGWKVRVWALGHGTKVGQGEVEVTTKKDLLLRLQAPRFFVQKDEVVLSANVHNYLKTEKDVTVSLETEGNALQIPGSAVHKVRIAANGEKRVDWRVKVTSEGEAVVRMKAVTDEESDAMQMRFPSYVHGMLKMDSFSGVIRPEKDSGKVVVTVPKERRPEQTRLEVRYSPTLAGAMVDALPYLVEYPYGCTEQTLNRFLPTVITQRTLQRMKLDLADIQKKRTNLNAQEIGDDQARAKQWKRFDRNPVFDEAEVTKMSREGVTALTNMQCGDGGWGWFSGFGERSYPHTTAVVVHGLQIARDNDIALVPGVLERGVAWLKNYQDEQIRWIKNAPTKTHPYKEYADDLDVLVYMVLVDNKVSNQEMREFLYRDRTRLSVYAKAMVGLALHKEKEAKKLEMVLQNIEQFLVEDDENQTAHLKLPGGTFWWFWYGNEVEANAWYLKLLAQTNPKDQKTSRLVKYLLNNRKHATYWASTRDTAYCIEAMADYIKNSGEDKPDMTVEVLLDGKKVKEVKIDAHNLFTFDNKLVLEGDAVSSGQHTVELRRKGTGPVYYNAYLTNFTLEDFITRAGLEVKVQRKYYKLTRDKSATIKVSGARGQAADQKVEKYIRTALESGSTLKSGDLVEVELEIDSKNDYEYLLFEDPRAAGFEPMAVRSGYNGNDMGAYMEVRDDRVAFFVRWLARGKHSVSYRMRAEIPGQFSALPAKASAMYAPELKGNSDEIKIAIVD
ncbi:MAG: MG2 domain-containing protein [Gemmataceae bacterium]